MATKEKGLNRGGAGGQEGELGEESKNLDVNKPDAGSMDQPGRVDCGAGAVARPPAASPLLAEARAPTKRAGMSALCLRTFGARCRATPGSSNRVLRLQRSRADDARTFAASASTGAMPRAA